MTAVIIAPRVEDPLSDAEKLLASGYFQIRPTRAYVAGGQWVLPSWSPAVKFNGTEKTALLDPLADIPYELFMEWTDGRGNKVQLNEFRFVTDSASPLRWENLTPSAGPGQAPVIPSGLEARVAQLESQMGSVSGGASTVAGITDMSALMRQANKRATATLVRQDIDAAQTSHTHPVGQIATTGGTPSGSTFLRGDGTWAAPAGVVAGSVTWDNVSGKPTEVTGLPSKLAALDATDSSLDARLDLLEVAGGTPSAPSGSQTLTWNGTTYGTYDTSKLRHDFVGGPDPLTLSNYASLLTAYDTWTEPDTPDPTTGDPNRVTVGLTSFPLASTNGPRGNNELVAYTYSVNQTVSPANQFGVEVVVDAATKKPKALYNRFTNTRYTDTAQSAFTGQTPIAAGEFLLSGHGNIDQPGYAGTWLWTTLMKDTGSGVMRVDTTKVIQLVIDTSTPTDPTNPSNPGVTGTWMSGCSETGVVRNGSFAAWRGRPVEIGGNWGPDSGALTDMISASDYEIKQGVASAAYGNIPAIDYACGAWTSGSGHTWATAASGALDSVWTQMIQRAKVNWGTRDASKFFWRFAHEFNGNWYPWKVTTTDVANYIAAFRRFAGLVRANFPGSQLVWCMNAGSSYSYNIRDLYPGDDYVDVIGTDDYNRDPFVDTQAEFDAQIVTNSTTGGSLGMETVRQFALSRGKPMCIPEWSNSGVDNGGGGGESPAFMTAFYNWLKANAGTGAGKVLYEILFNSTGYGDHYSLFPIDAESGNVTTAAKYAELWSTSVPPTDPGTGTPTPVPAGALPARVNSIWHHRWAGPNLRDYPESVKASLDLVVLALAQSGGAGTGNLSYQPNNGQSVADHAADCKAFVARGINVIMGFGGSSDGGITITNDAQADQAFASFASYRTTYGITGIDIDLEPSGSSWTQAAIVRLCTRLKQAYGSGFIIGITPGLYSPHTTRWMALAQALGNNFDYMAPMLYDFPEAGDSRLTNVALDKCNTMAAAGIPDSKMILGFMMRPPSEAYPNSTPTTTLVTNAINAVKAARPNLRGAFIWEDKIQKARSWDGTLAIRSTLPRS